MPDFKLPEYKGLVIKKQETEVTDEDVEKTLKSLADQRAISRTRRIARWRWTISPSFPTPASSTASR